MRKITNTFLVFFFLFFFFHSNISVCNLGEGHLVIGGKELLKLPNQAIKHVVMFRTLHQEASTVEKRVPLTPRKLG